MRKKAISFRGQKQGNKTKPKSETEISYFGKIETETKDQPKPLFLVMQKVWFDEVLSGRKIEEYRENTPFYQSRLLTKDRKFKRYSSVIMQEGYHANARRMTVEIKKIKLTDIFTIHLGNILDRQNFNKF